MHGCAPASLVIQGCAEADRSSLPRALPICGRGCPRRSGMPLPVLAWGAQAASAQTAAHACGMQCNSARVGRSACRGIR